MYSRSCCFQERASSSGTTFRMRTQPRRRNRPTVSGPIAMHQDQNAAAMARIDKTRARRTPSPASGRPPGTTDGASCAGARREGRPTQRLELVEFDNGDHRRAFARILRSRVLERRQQLGPGLRERRFVADDALLELEEALGVVLRVVQRHSRS